jgi:hypothetical protein
MKCDICNREMSKAKGCSSSQIKHKGKLYKRLTEHFGEKSGKCNDCGAEHGKYHHPGCDVERCPKCHGQLISCGCFDETGIDFIVKTKKEVAI